MAYLLQLYSVEPLCHSYRDRFLNLGGRPPVRSFTCSSLHLICVVPSALVTGRSMPRHTNSDFDLLSDVNHGSARPPSSIPRPSQMHDLYIRGVQHPSLLCFLACPNLTPIEPCVHARTTQESLAFEMLFVTRGHPSRCYSKPESHPFGWYSQTEAIHSPATLFFRPRAHEAQVLPSSTATFKLHQEETFLKLHHVGAS